jgi:C4-dicarboxylate-specific signal transduction histidine kinase
MARKSAPVPTSLDVNEAIRETVTLVGSELRRQRVVLRVELAAGLRSVSADRVQLQQVILNLMMNGMEAMATVDDRPRLLRLSTEMNGPRSVVVAIADVGVGLPAGKIERLFDAFYTTKPSGLGVGLAICRSIIEAYGGRLWVSTNMPHGAVFQFTLPTEDEHSS